MQQAESTGNPLSKFLPTPLRRDVGGGGGGGGGGEIGTEGGGEAGRGGGREGGKEGGEPVQSVIRELLAGVPYIRT